MGSTVVGQVTGGLGGLTRMVTDWANPNETVNRVEQDLAENFWLSFRRVLVVSATRSATTLTRVKLIRRLSIWLITLLPTSLVAS